MPLRVRGLPGAPCPRSPPLPPSEMSDAPRVRRSGFRTKSAMAANGEATEQAAEAAPEAAVSDADGAEDTPVVDDSAWMTADPALIAAAELEVCFLRDRVAKKSEGHLLLTHRDEYGGDTLHPAHNLPLDMLVRVMDFKGDPLFRTGGHGIGGLRCLECGELLMLLMMNDGKCPLTFHHYENDARRRGANKVLTTIAAGDYAVFRKHGSKMDQRGTISSIFLYLAATGGKEAQHLSGLGGADIALIANVWCGAQHTMTQVVRCSAHARCSVCSVSVVASVGAHRCSSRVATIPLGRMPSRCRAVGCLTCLACSAVSRSATTSRMSCVRRTPECGTLQRARRRRRGRKLWTRRCWRSRLWRALSIA